MNYNRGLSYWAIWQDFNAFGNEFIGHPAVCWMVLGNVFGWAESYSLSAFSHSQKAGKKSCKA